MTVGGGVAVSIGIATVPGRGKQLALSLLTLAGPGRVVVVVAAADTTASWSHAERTTIEGLAIVVGGCPGTDERKLPAACSRQAGVYLCCDDDILYPPQYVQTMAGAALSRPDALVGVHAINLPAGRMASYYRDRVVVAATADKLDAQRCVDVLGSGTIAWAAGGRANDALGELESRVLAGQIAPRMMDLHVAWACQQAGVALIAVPRPKGWVIPQRTSDAGCWEVAQRDGDAAQTELARRIVAHRDGVGA